MERYSRFRKVFDQRIESYSRRNGGPLVHDVKVELRKQLFDISKEANQQPVTHEKMMRFTQKGMLDNVALVLEHWDRKPEPIPGINQAWLATLVLENQDPPPPAR